MTKLSLACGLALSAALAACSSVPRAAPTATAAPAAGTAVATTASTTPKLVCEDTNQIGSHMQSHICLTPEQVEQRQKDSRQAAQDLQNRAQPLSSDGKPPV
ncbi:MAG TPA: hypothetical protein VGH91_03835 [Gammaproteobacteria bacterium]|jgi:hypothetical protein